MGGKRTTRTMKSQLLQQPGKHWPGECCASSLLYKIEAVVPMLLVLAKCATALAQTGRGPTRLRGIARQIVTTSPQSKQLLPPGLR